MSEAASQTRRPMNARGSFTIRTGVEADYHSFARSEVAIAGYRGPFPADETSDAVIEELIGGLLRAMPGHEHDVSRLIDELRRSDRLIVGWGVDRALALVAARWVEIDGLSSWHVTVAVVDPPVRRRKLLTHMVEVLVREEPADVSSAVITPSELQAFGRRSEHPLYRALRTQSPGFAIDPDRRGRTGARHHALAEALGEQLGVSDPIDADSFVVSDLGGTLRAEVRWAAAVPVDDRIRTVMVTGTNGKTSTVEFGRQLTESAGLASASFGTLGVVSPIGRVRRPRIGVGQRALPELADRLWSSGHELLWAEGFSYALQEGLVDALPVDVAAFTQIGSDHLGSHRSLASYWASKERLFQSILRSDGVAVVDPDAAGADRVMSIVERRGVSLVTTGPRGMVDLDASGVRIGDRSIPCTTGLTESVMVENARLALGCCVALGLDMDSIVAAVSTLTSPPGRFQEIHHGTDHRIVIDSAHNADALEASLGELRSQTDGRILLVVASVGSADETRWEPLGEVADVMADVVVVTDESPYRGSADRIRAAIRRGCPRAVDLPDRRAAIAHVLAEARPGDIVMIAGRADEDFLVDDGGSVPFPTDAELIHEALLRSGRLDAGSVNRERRPPSGTG